MESVTSSKGQVLAALGARLRRARLRRNPPLTLKQLAGDRLSAAMISRLERGDVLPSLDTLLYLAERLDVSIAALLDPAGVDRAAGAAAGERGRALLRLGRPEAALEQLTESLAIDPAGDAAFDRVEALVALGRAEDAAAAAATLPPSHPRTGRAVGLAQLARGRPVAAVAALRRAAEALGLPDDAHRPDRSPGARIAAAETLLALGRALDASGSRETAAITIRQAVRWLAGLTTTRDYALDVLARADAAAATSTALEALADAAWAATLDVHARAALARVELRLGRRRDALAALGPALAPAPAGEGSAEIASVVRDLAATDRGGSRYPASASPHAQAAAAHERVGDVAAAEEALRRAAIAERADGRPSLAASLLVEAATLWLRAGDRERALGLLAEAQSALQDDA